MEEMLTWGAIGKMINGEVKSEKEMVPVLQVTELELFQTKVEPMKERFKLVLSDGTHLERAIVVSSPSKLVKGILQTGSIVRLTQFICNVIQMKRIVVVLQLEVVSTKSYIIGYPVRVENPYDQCPMQVTPGAIVKMIHGEVTSEKDMVPVVQVTELRLCQSKITQPMKELYRMLLSDGTHFQVVILGTAQNGLVKEGILQVGSIVRLTQFICKVLQDRRVFIAMQLEVILTNSDIIGRPVLAQKLNDDVRGVDSSNKSNTTCFEDKDEEEDEEQLRKRDEAEIETNLANLKLEPGQEDVDYWSEPDNEDDDMWDL